MDKQALTQTQEAIHKSAKHHFMQYGYEKASLNQIIKETGFTKGAFYGYYSSKEELFQALVGDTVKGIDAILYKILDKFQQYEEPERLFHMTDEFLSGLPTLVDYIWQHHDEVVLLLKCARGTRYEDFFDSNLQKRNEVGGKSNLISAYGEEFIGTETFRIMISGYFSMIKLVFLSEMTKEEMILSITDIQMMFQTGIMKIVERKKEGDYGQ